MHLLEIEIDDWNPEHRLDDRQRKLLEEHSLTPIKFIEDAGGKRVAYGEFALVSVGVLQELAFSHVKVRRIVSNKSTQSLVEFGQRNTTVVNEKCSVAVAGLGLLTVDEVQVQTDFCTEHLQELLDEGWRILAICVQPDQRRPDYVLGRTKVRT